MKGTGIRNLYSQRGRLYYAKQVKGARPFIDLQTTDEAEAVRRIQEIRLNPIVYAAGEGLAVEARQFIAYKEGKRQYTRDSAKTKIIPLLALATKYPNERAATITVRQLEAFYASLLAKVSESTAEGYMMTLRSFFRWTCEVKRWRFDNPVKKIEIIYADPIIKKEFCSKELKNRLIADSPNDDLMFIQFCGFDAGLRRGEISEARVDWFNDSVFIQRSVGKRLQPNEREWRPKYNKERVVPLTEPFRAFLQRYLKGKAPNDFALRPEIPHGEWRYRYDFRYPLQDYWKIFHRRVMSAHIMRHSFASILKTEGKSIAKIAEWLGDSERVTERRYAWLKPDDVDIHALT